MQGPKDDPFVYMLTSRVNGTRYPVRYSHINQQESRFGYQSTFMGSESEVRRRIAAGELPDLPWR